MNFIVKSWSWRKKSEKSRSHVGKYDIGNMIDWGLDDNCGPILACYIGPKIAPDDSPRITNRVKPSNL